MKRLAIKVNNDSELNAVINLLESKGWLYRYKSNEDYKIFNSEYPYISYEYNFEQFNQTRYNFSDFEIISFKSFARLTGIKYEPIITIDISVAFDAVVKKDGVDFKAKNGYSHYPHWLSKEQFDKISEAFKYITEA